MLRKLMLVLCSIVGTGVLLIAIAYYGFLVAYDVPVRRIDVLASDVGKLTEMLKKYKEIHGDYPQDHQGLASLNVEGIPHQEYIPSIYMDPWGRNYGYRYPGVILIQPIEVDVRTR